MELREFLEFYEKKLTRIPETLYPLLYLEFEKHKKKLNTLLLIIERPPENKPQLSGLDTEIDKQEISIQIWLYFKLLPLELSEFEKSLYELGQCNAPPIKPVHLVTNKTKKKD